MIFIQFAILHLFVVSAWSHEIERIVNGTDAKEGQFPHQISIRACFIVYCRHVCGGSIISDKWVVTAKHCIVETRVSYKVVAGTISLKSGGTTVNIKQIIAHNERDIALLELMEQLVFTETIKPIKIARNEIPAGSNIIVSGWGSLEYYNGPMPDILQYNAYTITILSPQSCEDEVAALSEVSIDNDEYYDGLICLDSDEYYGSCSGDSGGPALYDGQLVGVCSFGADDCATAYPDIYTNVSYFRDWINEQTGLDL